MHIKSDYLLIHKSVSSLRSRVCILSILKIQELRVIYGMTDELGVARDLLRNVSRGLQNYEI